MTELGLDDRDTESDAGRMRIRDRFFDQFGLLSDEELAARTKLVGRTIKRWRQRVTTPQQAQAKIMLELLRQGLSVLVANEQDLAKLGEEARRRNELRQQRILHSEVNTLGDGIPVPSYYLKARGRIVERRYADAVAALEHWAAPPPDGGLEDVPEKTRPYLLNSYALCLYFMGRSPEAIEAWVQAYDHGVKVRADVNLLMGVRMMQGNAMWRAKRFNEAFELYDTLLLERPHFHYIYYNALCAASEEADALRLERWMGRLQAAAQQHIELGAFDEMLSRIESDPDLEWARRQSTWTEFMKWMIDVRRSMDRQTS